MGLARVNGMQYGLAHAWRRRAVVTAFRKGRRLGTVFAFSRLEVEPTHTRGRFFR